MKNHYKRRDQIIDSPIRCVIVDDNRHFLRVINDVLEYEGIAVAGLASTSAGAVRHVGRHRPDVVLVDVGLGRRAASTSPADWWRRHPSNSRL